MDTVRCRILSFALEIEREAPDAGEAEAKTEPVPQERVRHIYTTTIVSAGPANVAIGGSEFTQGVVQKGDLESLRNYLAELGIEREDVDAVSRDVGSDEPRETKIEKAKTWLWNLTLKSVAKAGEVGVNNIVALAAKALFSYLGVEGVHK